MNTREHERRHRFRRSHSPRPNPSVFSRIRHERSRSQRHNLREGGVFKRLGHREKNMSVRSNSPNQRSYSRYIKTPSENEDNESRHWKSRAKRKSRREEDDLSQPWVYEETDPFTPRIHYFDFLKTRMSSHVKTYDGSEDLEDYLKIFQAATKTEWWAMPTWCHMFNSTLTGNARVWFDDLPAESIDSYDDLKKRDGESTEDFVKRYKLESRDVKGAPERIRISGFVHGITNPKLIKRLYDKIPKTIDEMMRVTTSFLRGEVATLNHEKKKRVARQNITQIFSPSKDILFPPLDEEEGTKGLMIIEAEVRGHCIHRMYVDGRSPSPYNGIIRRPGVMKLRAVPSTVHRMLKIPVEGGVITLKSSRHDWRAKAHCGTLIECAGRGRVILGIHGQYQRAKGVSGESKRCPQSSIPEMFERRAEVEWRLASLNSDFHWTTKDEEAFKQMKQLIAELLMLASPMEKEELIVYLAAAKETASVVLMTERESRKMAIYFVSRALRGSETNYTSMEKLVLALVHASKRLKRYFQAHPIIVTTGQPIQQVLSRPEVAEEDSQDTLMEKVEELPEPWILFMDGSSCADGFGAGLLLTNPEGMECTYALRFGFDATNNKAGYEALIVGLRIAEQMVVEEEGDNWMAPIFKYLKEDTLPTDVKEAREVR
nr:reverse transcriptase domain-containing protein [Tanacetum cinerariifolium]